MARDPSASTCFLPGERATPQRKKSNDSGASIPNPGRYHRWTILPRKLTFSRRKNNWMPRNPEVHCTIFACLELQNHAPDLRPFALPFATRRLRERLSGLQHVVLRSRTPPFLPSPLIYRTAGCGKHADFDRKHQKNVKAILQRVDVASATGGHCCACSPRPAKQEQPRTATSTCRNVLLSE